MMKHLVAALVVLAVPALALAEAPKPGAKAVMWATEELKWADVPGFPVKTAVLWGDATKGEHGAFMKLPAGFEAPMHHHTADHHAVVVSGTVILGPEGAAEKKLGPGSYFEFTGMKKHTTKCAAGSDCVLLVDAVSAWDIVPEAKK